MFGFHKAYDTTGNIIAYEQGGPNDDESRAIYDNLCDREGCTHARISEAS